MCFVTVSFSTLLRAPQSHYFVVLVDGVAVPWFANATFSTAGAANFSNGTSTSNYTRLLVADFGQLPSSSQHQYHDVRIFKSTECQFAESTPSPNYLVCGGLWLEGNGTAATRPLGTHTHDHRGHQKLPLSLPLPLPDSPVVLPVLIPPPPRSKRRLAFIGDSMMAGYCNLLW